MSDEVYELAMLNNESSEEDMFDSDDGADVFKDDVEDGADYEPGDYDDVDA